MLDHVSITVGELGRASTFYDAIMHALGVPCVWREERAIGYGRRNLPGDDGHSYLTIRANTASAGMDAPGRHWCFRAPSRAAVDAFHAAGIANGGTTCEEPPGFRDGAVGKLYLAYLRDPDGNKICALHRPTKT